MSRYEFGIDFAAITAIDIHTHVHVDREGRHALDAELRAASAKYFKSPADQDSTAEGIAEHYRERNMAAVVFTVDAALAMKHPGNSVEDIAVLAAAHNDVLIPFGSVDPRRADALARAKSQLNDFGVKGFKFHPSLQAFQPND